MAILLIDGFFPFVPGETAVVTLSSVAAAAGGHDVWIVLAVAVAATVAGDGISFAIGRRVGIPRWRWMRGPRAQGALAWATTGLHRRPGLVLAAAKFLPFVRVVVTMTAGATGLAVRRYLPRSIVASLIYTAYHVAAGAIAGSWLTTNPLLGAVIAIAFVVIVGFVVDLATRVLKRGRFAPVATADD